MANEKLSPELQAILDEANSRGSLIDGHPDITPKSPDAPSPAELPCFSYPNGKPQPDPRSMGPQPTEQSGYGAGKVEGTVDDPKWREQHWPTKEREV